MVSWLVVTVTQLWQAWRTAVLLERVLEFLLPTKKDPPDGNP